MEQNKSVRYDWVDISKGFSIISIIAFHTLGGVFYNLIGPLCVPVFFILSGLVSKTQKQMVFIKKKAKSLLLPYVVFLNIGLIVTFSIPAWRERFNLKDAFLDLYYANPDAFNISSIWFLVCLFIVSVTCNSIIKLKPIAQVFVVVLISTFGFIYGALYMNKTITFRLPLDLDVALVAILFYMIGYWFKNTIFDFVNWFKSKRFIVEISIAAFFAVIWILSSFANGAVNLHAMRFNHVSFYLLSACSSSMFVFLISVIVEKTIFMKFMVWIGRNSLYIMGIQSIMVRLFILIINNLTNGNFQLYGLPYFYGAISFVFTTLTTLFVVFLYSRINTAIKNIKAD